MFVGSRPEIAGADSPLHVRAHQVRLQASESEVKIAKASHASTFDICGEVLGFLPAGGPGLREQQSLGQRMLQCLRLLKA